jgi:hypothetical protein
MRIGGTMEFFYTRDLFEASSDCVRMKKALTVLKDTARSAFFILPCHTRFKQIPALYAVKSAHRIKRYGSYCF